MAAMITVTDSLTGEPVSINADLILYLRRRDTKTEITFDHDKLCCKEDPVTVNERIRCSTMPPEI